MLSDMNTNNSGNINVQIDRGDGSYSNQMFSGDPPFVPVDTWTHISVTRDQSLMYKVYENGVLKQSGQGFNLNEGNGSYELGKGMGRAPSGVGNLDEIRFWNYARNENEIKAQMNKELTGDEPGLFGYWNFNQYTSSSLSLVDVTGLSLIHI